jgi:hypothetical protein
MLLFCSEIIPPQNQNGIENGVVIHGHKTFSSPTLNRNSFKTIASLCINCSSISPMGPPDVNIACEVPPKREIALEH